MSPLWPKYLSNGHLCTVAITPWTAAITGGYSFHSFQLFANIKCRHFHILSPRTFPSQSAKLFCSKADGSCNNTVFWFWSVSLVRLQSANLCYSALLLQWHLDPLCFFPFAIHVLPFKKLSSVTFAQIAPIAEHKNRRKGEKQQLGW